MSRHLALLGLVASSALAQSSGNYVRTYCPNCVLVEKTLQLTGTSPQLTGPSGAALGIQSSSGQNATLDCGGGTCSVLIGGTNATSITLGRAGVGVSTNDNITVGGGTVNSDRHYSQSTGTATISGNQASNGSAVGVVVDNRTTLTTAGDKSLSIRDNGTEVAFIDYLGKLTSTAATGLAVSPASGGAGISLNATSGSLNQITSVAAAAGTNAGASTLITAATGGAGSGSTAGGAGAVLQLSGGAGGVAGSTAAAGAGGNLIAISGAGQAAGATSGAAGVGGVAELRGAAGGDGTAGTASARGGHALMLSGPTGANNGGGVGAGGDVHIQTGSTTGTAGTIYIGDATANGPGIAVTAAAAIKIGTSTTTKPVQIVGGSGAAVGSITLSSGTGTATVPTGAICVCDDSTAVNTVRCVVASTTLTATGTTTDVVKYICL